jgi:hypothetical protein
MVGGIFALLGHFKCNDFLFCLGWVGIFLVYGQPTEVSFTITHLFVCVWHPLEKVS